MSIAYLNRCFFYLLGIVINFLGVTLLVKSEMGAGFWAAFFTGLSEQLGLTVGMWYGFFQLIFIFVNGYLLSKRPEYWAIIPLILETIILDFWLEVVFKNVHLTSAPLFAQIIVFITGIILVSLGVAIYIMPGFPRAPIDQLFLAFSERFNWTIRASQTFVAVVVAGTAFLIGGPVGIGTVVVALTLGSCIQFWYEKLTALSKLYSNKDVLYSS
ncbi:YitT family protein [Alteribacillus sp. JSM 102045]|uniref:YczE/YyaS/YitT family protein n=1 Tax=Alteribacillus sp. JSM 102045 TaxID=1562101 RepID=UPI0035C11FC4